MKYFILSAFMGGLALPVSAGSDGSGSRYFDPDKIATWSTCARDDTASGQKATCVPSDVGELLQSYPGVVSE